MEKATGNQTFISR